MHMLSHSLSLLLLTQVRAPMHPYPSLVQVTSLIVLLPVGRGTLPSALTDHAHSRMMVCQSLGFSAPLAEHMQARLYSGASLEC